MLICKNILLLLFLTSTVWCHAVSGEGNITSEKRQVTEFRDLTINGPFKIVFTNDYHSDFFIKTETDKNLQQYITVTQIDLSVFVNIKPGVKIEKFSKLVLYIDNRDIHSLTINSNTNQVSDIVWPMICERAHLKISGSIPISVNLKLMCHQPQHTSASFNDKINHSRLVAEIDNARTTNLSGDLEEADIVNNGAGAMKAYDLKVDLLRIRNNSIAAVEVYSDHEFNINNTGSGHIYYRGEGTVRELKESMKGTTCREDYTAEEKPALAKTATIASKITTSGFNTDSFFLIMSDRDQLHRQHLKQGDTLQTTQDDAENFICLQWYLEHYGYPEFNNMELNGLLAAIIDHIDNYENFEAVKIYLLKAVKEGKLLPNTFAYANDRSFIAAHKRPLYYYFFAGSEWDNRYKPDAEEQKAVNSIRHEIGLPDYPHFLNGKYF